MACNQLQSSLSFVGHIRDKCTGNANVICSIKQLYKVTYQQAASPCFFPCGIWTSFIAWFLGYLGYEFAFSNPMLLPFSLLRRTQFYPTPNGLLCSAFQQAEHPSRGRSRPNAWLLWPTRVCGPPSNRRMFSPSVFARHFVGLPTPERRGIIPLSKTEIYILTVVLLGCVALVDATAP